jgi:IS605 OrfB family transposase
MHGQAQRTVLRTARVVLRPTKSQKRRLFGLLRSAADVWSWVLDCNRQLHRWNCPTVTNYQALCRELTGNRFGELDIAGARSVLRRYSQAWYEAARRPSNGNGFPRRKRALVPVRFSSSTSYHLEQQRVRLPVAKGCPELWVRLSRPIPYPLADVRSITLLADAGQLVVDVTARVPTRPTSGSGVVGVDLGIINPYTAVLKDEALIISGRAIRAESRLHLSDTKRRSARAPNPTTNRAKRGRRGRKVLRKQRQSETRHRRRVRQAHHEAAQHLIVWAQERGAGTLVIGNPVGLIKVRRGSVHNLRLQEWRRNHLLSVLRDKALVAGMNVTVVDERGTSSKCPECSAHRKPVRGRAFICSKCGHASNRDLVGARNIATLGGGDTCIPVHVQHRRAGQVPARRDRRRHLMDVGRSCPAPGRAKPPRPSESLIGVGSGGTASTDFPTRPKVVPVRADSLRQEGVSRSTSAPGSPAKLGM